MIPVGMVMGAAAYTGLLVASITGSAIDVIDHLTTQAKSNPRPTTNAEAEQQYHKPARMGIKDIKVIPLREAYLKVSKVVAGINEHLGFNVAVQLMHHGMFLIVFVAVVTDTSRMSMSSPLRVGQHFITLTIHAAVLLRLLSVAETLTQKVYDSNPR
jgi:hypothetical protein